MEEDLNPDVSLDPEIRMVVVNSSPRLQGTKWAADYAIKQAELLKCKVSSIELRGKKINPCTQ